MTVVVTTRSGERWALKDSEADFWEANGPDAISNQEWVRIWRADRKAEMWIRTSEITRIEFDGRVGP